MTAYNTSVALHGSGGALGHTQHVGYHTSVVLVGTGGLLTPETTVPNPEVWDSNNRAWGEANFVYSEAKPVMLRGNEFFQVDSTQVSGTTPLPALLTRTGLTITGRARDGSWKIDPGTVKEITGLYPMIKGKAGTEIFLWVGAQEETPDDPVSWEGPYKYVLGQGYFQDFTVSGRYLAVRFEVTAEDATEFLSYDLDLEDVGNK